MEEKKFFAGEIINEAWLLMKKTIGIFILWAVIAFMFYMVIQLINNVVQTTMPTNVGVMILVQIISMITSILISVGFIKLSLNTVDKSDVAIGDFFADFNTIWKYFKATILIVIFVGLPLIILFGIIFFLLFKFADPSTITLTKSFNGLPFVPGFEKYFADSIKTILADPAIQTILLYGSIIFIVLLVITVYIQIRLMFFGYLVVDKNIGARQSLYVSASMTKGIVWKIFLLQLLLGLINILGLICCFVGLLVTMPITYIANTILYRKLVAYVEQPPIDEQVVIDEMNKQQTDNDSSINKEV